jgi:hypothetical protein
VYPQFLDLQFPNYDYVKDLRPYMLLNLVEIMQASYPNWEQGSEVGDGSVEVDKVRTWLYCELMLKLHERGEDRIQAFIHKVCPAVKTCAEDLTYELQEFYGLS